MRKLRVALSGHGKRSGARVIYYWWPEREWCYLVFAHAKNERADMTRAQLRALATLMGEVIEDG